LILMAMIVLNACATDGKPVCNNDDNDPPSCKADLRHVNSRKF
jgi:hypothetical protein